MPLYFFLEKLCPSVLYRGHTILEKFYFSHIFFFWSKQCNNIKKILNSHIFVGGGASGGYIILKTFAVKKKK